MVCKRLAFLAAVVGPVVIAGCTSCPGERTSFFDRFRRHPRAECCDSAVMAPVTEGPVLTDGTSTAVVPPTNGSCGSPQIAPAPTPRLVPTPQVQSQPRPYVPQ